jgi:hypothetical protein
MGKKIITLKNLKLEANRASSINDVHKGLGVARNSVRVFLKGLGLELRCKGYSVVRVGKYRKVDEI